MSSAFGCPHCRNVIQTAHPVPAGKQVKCPFCKGYFLAPVTGPLPVAQVAPPTAAIPVAGMTPPGMPPIPVAGMSPPPIPDHKHKKDKKRRKHRRHRHSARTMLRGSSSLVKVLLAGVALLALVARGAGGFLLFSGGAGRNQAASTDESTQVAANPDTPNEDTPTETKPTEKKQTKSTETKSTEKKGTPKKNPTKGPEDPLVLVAANSPLIMGGNVKVLAELPAFKGLAAGPLAKLSADLKRDTGKELAEFAESVTVAWHGSPADPGAKMTMILKSQAAFDVDKLAASPAVADAVEAKGKTYYKLKPDSGLAHGKKDALLFIPSNRLLVISDVPAADFEQLIGGDLAKPALTGKTLAVVRELEKQPIWAYVTLGDDFKKELQAGLMADKAPEELQADRQGIGGRDGPGAVGRARRGCRRCWPPA